MRNAMAATIMAATLVCGLWATVANAQSALLGASRVTEIADPGKPVITSPQPGLMIFTKQHYGFIRINGAKPLPDCPSNDKATDAQKIAAFDVLYLNAGTYSATAESLSAQSFVAKSAFAMAGPRNRFDYAIKGDSLLLTQRPQGTVIKFVHVE